MSPGRFLEAFVDAPAEVCRARDVKGPYRKAEVGKISNVAGRDQPYEHRRRQPWFYARPSWIPKPPPTDFFRLALAHV